LFKCPLKIVVNNIFSMLNNDPGDSALCEGIVSYFSTRPFYFFELLKLVVSAHLNLTQFSVDAHVNRKIENSNNKSCSQDVSNDKDDKIPYSPRRQNEKPVIIRSENVNGHDIFQLDKQDCWFPQLIYRFYLFHCFKENYNKSLAKIIEDLYKADFDEKSLKSKDIYIQPIISIFKELIKFDQKLTQFNELHLFFQILFEFCSLKCEDTQKNIHHLGSLVIEYICYCIEHPIFLKIGVVDGVRHRPITAVITNLLRNFAYRKIVFTKKEEFDLYEQFVNEPIISEFINWVSLFVHNNVSNNVMLSAIEEFYDVYFQLSSLKLGEEEIMESSFLIRHFALNIELIKDSVSTEMLEFFKENISAIQLKDSKK